VINASSIPFGGHVRVRVIRNRHNIIVGIPVYTT